MISKPIDLKVPKRLKSIYQHGLGEGNPNVIHDKVTALEVGGL